MRYYNALGKRDIPVGVLEISAMDIAGNKMHLSSGIGAYVLKNLRSHERDLKVGMQVYSDGLTLIRV